MKLFQFHLVVALAAITSLPVKADLVEDIDSKLDSVQGKRVKTYKGLKETTEKPKYLAIYFSAHWCPPCRAFTPRLVEWYNKTKPEHPEFELIFVSSDRSEDAMEKYMIEYKMPWPALKHRSKDNLSQYSGKGIPCLVFIDATTGEVISHSYVNNNYVGPVKVLGDINKTLKSKKSKKS